MKPVDYARLKEVFIAACDRDPAQRDALLCEACGDDVGLREAVERLLAADGHEDGLLRSAVAAGGAEVALPGQIGPYEVQGILGVGGMGVVYRARQEAPRREVAIKVLREGLRSPRMTRRFAREAEVLGHLQHPGIAQVFEAGTWDGRPYFVMELIDGVPLTDYARTAGLDARQRMHLLAEICLAVHHAHENGVVHRDLKPGNILVTPSGQPKVLDFGIARATDADLQMTTIRTDPGLLVGTLPYMAPEQVAGDPSRVDARCDVYALGVLMYELLTDRLPYDLANRSVPDAARVIRDEEPTLLRTINRSYRGDLEAIACAALEKDRDRRYSSAAVLAAELRRYLNNEVLLTRPPSTFYQIGKFARRHKGLTAGLAASFVLLVAGTVVSTVFAMRATQRSRELRVEAEKLGALNAFFQSMLTAADPEVNRLELEVARDVRVVDVLDWAAGNLATAYPDQPEVEATLRMTLGSTYWTLALREQALQQFETAVELRSASLGREHPETLRAELEAILAMSSRGLQPEAEARARRLLPICERVFGREHESTITCLGRLYGQLYYQQRWDEARVVGEEYLTRAMTLPPNHEDRRGAVIDLAYLYMKLGEPQRALEMFRETTGAAVRMYGDLDPRTILSKHNVVLALEALGQFDDAISLERDVEAAQTTVLGPDHYMRAEELDTLARLLRADGAVDEAERVLRDAIEVGEVVRDQSRFDLGAIKLHLAGLLAERSGEIEAEALAREAIALRIDGWGPDHLRVAEARAQLGLILAGTGRREEAGAEFGAALPVLEREGRGDDPATLDALATHGRGLLERGDYEKAAVLLTTCYERRARLLGPAHELTIALADDLVRMYERQDRSREAAAWRRRRDAMITASD